jgi:para-aminobenzoate synthetase/4-amino-4-deoxychorismate lyase
MPKSGLSEFYRLVETRENSVLLETFLPDISNRFSFLFIDPIQTLQIREISEVDSLLSAIDDLVKQGYYLAGYFGYESGYNFEKLAMPGNYGHTRPLAWFGVYEQPVIFDHREGQTLPSTALEKARASLEQPPQPGPGYAVNDIRFNLSEAEYSEKVARVKEYIQAGDIYQANLTGRYHFKFEGSPMALYKALKLQQPVSYGAYIHSAGQHILSFSPELFFRIEGQQITTRPMKGTVATGRDAAEDARQSQWLRNDEKNRAENVMIVDLLRNDLGQVCETGSVKVTELFTIEKYPTVFQMTSTIEGSLRPNLSYSELFRSLFPCGSITGAPKIRAMQIIRELETTPRGVYTGAIGYIAPESPATPANSSKPENIPPYRAVFNIAIRTITLDGAQGEMGVGGGIVIDSMAEAEYNECAAKAAFLTSLPVEFSLLEAILWDQDYKRLPQHLERLEKAARHFDYPYDEGNLKKALAAQATGFKAGDKYKVRLVLDSEGKTLMEAIRIDDPPTQAPKIIAISPERVTSTNRFAYYKTTNRAIYNRVSALAAREDYADLIFLNEREEVTEGASNNIFIEKDGQLFTPPQECGLLNGVYRRVVLEENSNAREKVLYLTDLLEADNIFVCNSIRGWRKVILVIP